jgi:hypothetical protein
MEDLPDWFTPQPTRNRYAGWTETRQMEFIRTLAETGSVTQSAAAVGMSPASAYRLRARQQSSAFGRAWDVALRHAGNQLLALALDRAVNGARQLWVRDGQIVGERIVPSDRLLIWAIDRLAPRTISPPSTENLGAAIANICHDDTDRLGAEFRDMITNAASTARAAEPQPVETCAQSLPAPARTRTPRLPRSRTSAQRHTQEQA